MGMESGRCGAAEAKVLVSGVGHGFERRGQTIQALESVDLAVEKGEFVTVVGPSGCGKTTLLFVVAGFHHPTAGEVRVGGQKVRGPGPDRGVVFQSYALFKWLTVGANVEFGLKMRGLSRKERLERADHFINLVGLSRFRDRYPYELSGGMQQRVAIARAFANDPDILLMDEPFGALDAQSREMLQEELLRVSREERKTVIFITHSIDEAIYLSDRVVVFTCRPGRIKHEMQVELGESRFDYHVRTSSEFVQAKDAIVDLVREETVKQYKEEFA